MRKNTKKSLSLLLSLALLLAVAVGGTLAFLVAKTEPIENTFTPSKVTTEVVEDTTSEPGTKQNVQIKNTGDTAAWIRAAVVITWQTEDGKVYGQLPAEGTDYTIDWNVAQSIGENGWFKGDDGFYYWTSPVAAGGSTGALITSCKPVENTAPEGYYLTVEVLGSGLQSVPAEAFNSAWGSSGLSVNDDGTALKGGN